MDRVKELALQLNLALKEAPSVQEYLALKAAIEKSDLLAMEEELKNLQQEMVQKLHREEMESYQQVKQEYEQRKQAYESNPLLVNYHYALEQVNELMQQVAFIMDQSINFKR